jgi:hypothetical protein
MIKTDECLLNNYEATLKKADQLVAQKNYNEALKVYDEALKIYPREDYPSKRITEINTLLSKQQNSAEVYKKIIAEADALSDQGNYNEDLQKYNQAAVLNPQDSYPKQKAAEMNSTLAQQKAAIAKEEEAKKAQLTTLEKYNQAMARASVAYTRKDYDVAKQYYQEALLIKPEESLAKSRVQEIETIQAKKASENAAKAAEIAQKAAFEKEYQNLVAQADEQFKAKKFDEAKAMYAKASLMKPAESYPAQRVKVIETALASEQASIQKSKDESYNNAMTAGNNALAKNQFQLAKDSYQQALVLKPDDLAAKSRFAEVDKLAAEFAKRKNIDEQYNNLIQSGDAQIAKKELVDAKATFNQALTLKPGDKYATTKITAIDNTIAAQQAALAKTQNDQYEAAVSNGNNALAQNQFTLAKESFQKALTFKANDYYALNRITETERLSAQYSKQIAQNEDYKKFIETADNLMSGKELTKARESYSQALVVKPGDQYAQGKITTIDNTIAAEQAAKLKVTEEGYKAAIGAANTAIAQKLYSQAKEFLQRALTIKPGDIYAAGKVAEMDKLIADQQKKVEQDKLLTQQYNDIIALGDKDFGNREYSKAKISFLKALQIKPDDSYASQKVVSIDNILAAEIASKQKQVEESYTAAMSRGSDALIAKNYSAGKEAFQLALNIKPGDNNAKLKLAEADLMIRKEQELIAQEQAKKKKYDEIVLIADKYYAQKNYASAKTYYEQALLINPSISYPRQKLDETIKAIEEQERLTAEAKAKESAYNIALANADKYFKAKDYQQAKDEYTRASILKPGEPLPKTKISEIESLIALKIKEQTEAKNRADAYTAAINSGNAAFNKKDYPGAKIAYNEALKHMPGDLLASDQIKKIDYLMTEAEKMRKTEQEKKAAYDALIALADKSFDGGKYPEAKDNYKKALVIDPSSTYAKQRIVRIDEISRILAQSNSKTNTSSTAVTTSVAAAAPLKELVFKNESERQTYLDELMKKYPSGITLEKYKEQFKETLRYIIIRDNQAQEFRHVKYTTYSGAQYSVNGKPITQQYFLTQIKIREGESYNEISMQ